jgi:hypothetical protein
LEDFFSCLPYHAFHPTISLLYLFTLLCLYISLNFKCCSVPGFHVDLIFCPLCLTSSMILNATYMLIDYLAADFFLFFFFNVTI